jgi:hypothetical protein
LLRPFANSATLHVIAKALYKKTAGYMGISHTNMKKIRDENALWVIGSIMALLSIPIIFILGLITGINIEGSITLSQDNMSSWVTAFATVVIAVLTIVLAKETWSLRNIQLIQIEQIRKDAIKPNVDLYLKSSPAAFNFIDVHIINNGTGSAQNVTFSFENKNTKESEIFKYVVSLFKKLNILNYGISSLGVNEKRSGFVLNFVELNKKYKDRNGPQILDSRISVIPIMPPSVAQQIHSTLHLAFCRPATGDAARC